MGNKDTIMVRVPPELKKEFQILCLQNDTNMSDVLRQFIEEYVEKNKKR